MVRPLEHLVAYGAGAMAFRTGDTSNRPRAVSPLGQRATPMLSTHNPNVSIDIAQHE